jgi:hypothetical protein
MSAESLVSFTTVSSQGIDICRRPADGQGKCRGEGVKERADSTEKRNGGDGGPTPGAGEAVAEYVKADDLNGAGTCSARTKGTGSLRRRDYGR